MSQPPIYANIGLISATNQYFSGTQANDLVIFSTSNQNVFMGQTNVVAAGTGGGSGGGNGGIGSIGQGSNYVQVGNAGVTIATGSNSIVSMSNASFSNIRASTGTFSNIYTSNMTANIIASTGEVQTNGYNSYRLVNNLTSLNGGNYGMFMRNDGVNGYFMATSNNDPLGPWTQVNGNNSIPFSFNLSNMNTGISQGAITCTASSGNVIIKGALTAPSGTFSNVYSSNVYSSNVYSSNVYSSNVYTTNGEIQTSGMQSFRLSTNANGGNYGMFWRNDGVNCYLMATTNNDPNGGWYTLNGNISCPFSFSLSTLDTSICQGAITCTALTKSVSINNLAPNIINRGSPASTDTLLLSSFNTTHFYNYSGTGVNDINIPTTMVENAIYELYIGLTAGNDTVIALLPNSTTYSGISTNNLAKADGSAGTYNKPFTNNNYFSFDLVDGIQGTNFTGKITIHNFRNQKRIVISGSDTVSATIGTGIWPDTTTQWLNVGKLASSASTATVTLYNIMVKRVA